MSQTQQTDEQSASQNAIIITGVGQRAGFFLAQYFCQKGWTVLGTYRSEKPSLDQLRQQACQLFQADYQDISATEQQIAAIKQSLAQNHLSLRAIIHNASDWQGETPGETDGRIMDRMMNIHARVPYMFNQSLVDHFDGDSGGDIIHLTDYVASTGSAKHMAYAASKAALENLTLSMAKRFGPAIKVNGIAPALIEFNEGDSEAYKVKALKKNMIPAVGSFETLADTVDFILSNHYLTGRIIPLDGGRHLM